MKRHTIVALTLLIFSLNISVGAASAKVKWMRVRSKNFTLVSCGARLTARHIVVTYRAATPKAGAKFDGEALVVDFVPEDLEVEN
jgi:hypothetical protein